MKQHTLSRTAERIYWLGRYLERAESTARLINVNANLLIDLPRRMPLAWQSLVDIMGNRAHFNELYTVPDERNVVRYLTADARNPGSLVSSLSMARENARTIREIMPSVAFEYTNELYLYAKEQIAGTLSRSRTAEAMNHVMRRVQHIAGFLAGTMMHGETWSFLRIGESLERADMTTRIIDVRSVDMLENAADLTPYSQLQWRSVLRSLHTMQSYRLAVQEPITQPLVLEFLFKNPQLPRSLAYCLNRIRTSLRGLRRHDKPLAAINRVLRLLAQTDVTALTGDGLHRFIDALQLQHAELHQVIDRTYFHARLRIARPRTGRETA
jgi:uncharacterized alpha-E superfamily protein